MQIYSTILYALSYVFILRFITTNVATDKSGFIGGIESSSGKFVGKRIGDIGAVGKVGVGRGVKGHRAT